MYLWETAAAGTVAVFFCIRLSGNTRIKEEIEMKRKSMLALLLAVSMTCSMTAATGAVAYASDDTATEETADESTDDAEATEEDADAADAADEEATDA